MLVTALSPTIGYDKASAIAHKADDEGTSLRDAALGLGVAAADFDRTVDPSAMVGHPRNDQAIQGRFPEVRGFARGLLSDFNAVTNGLTQHWSSGPVEGHVNRVKMMSSSRGHRSPRLSRNRT